jgi:hypothetical protein
MLVALSFAQEMNAQNLSVRLYGGVLNYQGDLRQEVYTFQGVRLGGGIGLSYRLSPNFSAGVHFLQGRIAAADRNNSDPGLYYRNLDFFSNISELNLMGSFHLTDPEKTRLSPYITGGLAVFRFNPFTRDSQGEKFYLQPLGTEGQGLPGYPQAPYRRNQISIPFGGGIDFKLTDKVSLAWEVIFRMTGTDYLDDVSTVYANQIDLFIGRGPKAVELAFRGDEVTGVNPVFLNGYPDGAKRGNPGAKDWYYYSGLRFTYRLSSRERGGAGANFGKSRTDCPRW